MGTPVGPRVPTGKQLGLDLPLCKGKLRMSVIDKEGRKKFGKEWTTHRLVHPVGHLPDDGLQLDHGHVGGLIVGVRGVVAEEKA